MSFPEVINIQLLCEPFEGENSVGAIGEPDVIANLDYGIYRDLREYEDQRIESMWGRSAIPEPPQDARWSDIGGQAATIIQHQAKDLRAICKLAVASSFSDGLGGIRDGLRLIHAMLEQYGEKLLPQPFSVAIKSLPSVASLLTSAVKLAPLSEDSSEGVNLIRFEVADYLADVGNRDRLTSDQMEFFQRNAMSLKAVTDRLLISSPEHAKNVCETITEAQAASAQLVEFLRAFLKKHLGDDGATRDLSGFIELQNTIGLLAEKRNSDGSFAGFTAVLRRIAEKQDHRSVSAIDTNETSDKHASSVHLSAGHTSGEATQPTAAPHLPVGRRQAIEALKGAKAYFETAEPHSPLPFILDRAISWCDQPLDRILKELLGSVSGAAAVLEARANISLGSESNTDDSVIETQSASQEIDASGSSLSRGDDDGWGRPEETDDVIDEEEARRRQRNAFG